MIADENYPEAIPFLERLEAVADIPQDRTFAQSNLMKAFFLEERYEQVLSYARKVLQNPSLDERIRSDARLMIARAARETGDMETARSGYAGLLDTATGETAAEALYHVALFAQQDGDLEASNATVQKLAKEYAAYREWGGKGLILLAQNFYELDDVFQATYILENVVNNFGDFPEIAGKAEAELQRIRAREAERNSSINPEGN